MTGIVTYTDIYKRPPGKRAKAAAIEGQAIITIRRMRVHYPGDVRSGSYHSDHCGSTHHVEGCYPAVRATNGSASSSQRSCGTSARGAQRSTAASLLLSR